VNCTESDLNGREEHKLHPALTSFLHRARREMLAAQTPEAPLLGADAWVALDDNSQETLQHDAAFHSNGATMQVLLVSPPSPFSTTVAEVLHRIDPGCRITHAARMTRNALQRVEKASLALIDLDAFTEEGEALIRELAARPGRLPIVALSSSLENGFIDRALEAGAVGYLPKTYAEPLIEGVLRVVIGGEGYRPQGERSKAAKRGRPPAPAPNGVAEAQDVSGLTPREKQVLIEVARGCTNLEIAKRLDMKEPTVKTHLHTIFRKLNVQNRAGAALCAVRMTDIQQAQIEEAERGRLNLSWLQPEMSHRRMRQGQWIFHLGEPGNELYYVQRGKVALPELGVTVGPGEVFGEIGIFAPEHKRTSSARCETEVDLFALSSEQVRRIYFVNPQFAFFIVTLIATRLMADRRRTDV